MTLAPPTLLAAASPAVLAAAALALAAAALVLGLLRRRADERTARLLAETEAARADAAERARMAEEVTAELERQAADLQASTAELEVLNEEIAASEARLRAVIDSALDAVISTDARSVVTEWSAHAESMFGWTAEEAIGRTLAETIIPAQHREAHDAGVRRYLESGIGPILNRRVEITALRRDGTEFPVELTVAPARWGGEVVFSAFVRDLTESRRAAARIMAEHDVTRALAEAATVQAAAVPMLRAMGTALGWDVGVLWEPDGARMRASGLWHREDVRPDVFRAATVGAAFGRGEGLPGLVWDREAPVWVEDAAAEPSFTRAPAALADGLHGAFALPVTAGGEVLGVMEFLSRRVMRADAELLEMAGAIGGEVGQAFRRMRAEEERDRALAGAERANESLRRANAQLAARTGEAERARAAAEEANRAKSDFLAVMSHELRTPINAVLGYTDLMEMGIGGPVSDEQRGYLARVRSSALHLLGLVDDVLDLSKIEAGRMGVVRGVHASGDAILAALSLVAPQAQAKGIRLENACDGEGPAYAGDHDRVLQVLVNLLSNAVKFTPEGGAVTVSCGTAKARPEARLAGLGPWVCLQVEDTGVGIAAEEAESIFDPFVQSETGHTRTRGGTGLGLTISRRLARLMDGDLTLRSEPGRGSCFTLWLPAAVPRPAGAEAVEAPSAGADPAALRHAADALQRSVAGILDGFVTRVRADPRIPVADRTDAEIQDHQAALLADVAQSLSVLGDAPGEVTLLQDGSEFQRLLSHRHGEQRARLGWDRESVRREFAILREEVEAALSRADGSGGEGSAAAWEVLGRLMGRAESVVQEALAAARGDGQDL